MVGGSSGFVFADPRTAELAFLAIVACNLCKPVHSFVLSQRLTLLTLHTASVVLYNNETPLKILDLTDLQFF